MRKLGKSQVDFLAKALHNSQEVEGRIVVDPDWTWRSPSDHKEVLQSLVKRGLVTEDPLSLQSEVKDLIGLEGNPSQTSPSSSPTRGGEMVKARDLQKGQVVVIQGEEFQVATEVQFFARTNQWSIALGGSDLKGYNLQVTPEDEFEVVPPEEFTRTHQRNLEAKKKTLQRS